MRVSSSEVPLLLLAAYVPLSVLYSFSALQAVIFLLVLFMIRTQVGGESTKSRVDVPYHYTGRYVKNVQNIRIHQKV